MPGATRSGVKLMGVLVPWMLPSGWKNAVAMMQSPGATPQTSVPDPSIVLWVRRTFMAVVNAPSINGGFLKLPPQKVFAWGPVTTAGSVTGHCTTKSEFARPRPDPDTATDWLSTRPVVGVTETTGS